MRTHWLLMLALVGCGDDPAPPPPPPGGGGGGGGGKAAKGKASAAKTKALVPKLKVEDRVTDPAEKLSLRHQFKDRDFAVEQSNRDPFQSFVLGQKGLVPTDGKLDVNVTKRCLRPDQFIATNYSYADLRLVGIVAERAQRKVLMMDAGNLGHIIKKGDCVGREKAVVKDIGAGFITFQLHPEDSTAPMGQQKTVEEHSVQLYPNQMPVQSQPTPDAPKTQTPVVAPPSSTPPVAPQGVPVEQP